MKLEMGVLVFEVKVIFTDDTPTVLSTTYIIVVTGVF